MKVKYQPSKHLIGSGGQAKIYKCQIEKEGHEGITYATKVREALRKQGNEYNIMDESTKEFMLGIIIKHPNIIDYKYFTKELKGKKVLYHIIMEYIEGLTLSKYIKQINNNRPPTNI